MCKRNEASVRLCMAVPGLAGEQRQRLATAGGNRGGGRRRREQRGGGGVDLDGVAEGGAWGV